MSKNPPAPATRPAKAKKPRAVPSVDDPTAAFPIGVLAGLIDEEGSEEGRTPTGPAERPPATVATPKKTPAPSSSSGLQLRLLGLSLLVGAGAATLVALVFGAAMLVVGR